MLRLAVDRLGATNLLPESGEYYACPCCLTVYDHASVDIGNLTIEHVPPEGVGGRGLPLTCKECNNSAGREFDSHAVTRLNAR